MGRAVRGKSGNRIISCTRPDAELVLFVHLFIYLFDFRADDRLINLSMSTETEFHVHVYTRVQGKWDLSDLQDFSITQTRRLSRAAFMWSLVMQQHTLRRVSRRHTPCLAISTQTNTAHALGPVTAPGFTLTSRRFTETRAVVKGVNLQRGLEQSRVHVVFP